MRPDPSAQNAAGDSDLADIFHEVDEEVRRERLRRLWERFGTYIVALAVLIIVGIGGWRGYQYWQDKQAAKAGAAFESAMALVDSGKHQEAADAFAQVAKDAPRGYATLARLRQAAEIAPQDVKAAIAAFDAIAADGGVQLVFQDLAALRAGYLLVDTAPYGEVQSRLEQRTAAGRAFRHSAREVLALSAWRANDLATARRWSDLIINDSETPASIRARVEILSALLPPQAKS